MGLHPGGRGRLAIVAQAPSHEQQRKTMYFIYFIVSAVLCVFGVFTYFHFWPDPAYDAYVGSSTDRHLKAVEGPEPEDERAVPPPNVW